MTLVIELNNLLNYSTNKIIVLISFTFTIVIVGSHLFYRLSFEQLYLARRHYICLIPLIILSMYFPNVQANTEIENKIGSTEELEFSDIDSFGDFLEWVKTEFEDMKSRHLEKEPGPEQEFVLPEVSAPTIKNAPNDGPLDLSLPHDTFDEGADFTLENDRKLNMPDLFAKKSASVKEKEETTSFGGRLLMDENFEELDQYRIQDIRNSIQGAELTFEVKTN